MTRRLSVAWALIKETFSEWNADNAMTRAAALAYYTIFSIAPMLIIAIAIAGALFGADAARGEIHRQINGLVGDAGSRVIEDMIDNAGKPGRGVLATIISVVVLIFAATGVFGELQSALNAFWKADPPKTNGVISFLRTRFVSFTMVLGIGFLLLVSLVISAVLAAVGNWASAFTDQWKNVVGLINTGVSFGAITALFAMIYKYLPDRKVAWSDVWLGALVTSLLFNLGKLGIALYIAKTSVASTYGAAGSVAVLLVWVYFSSMILFLGAEFTQVYARMFGSLHHTPKKRKEHTPWPSHPGITGTARSAGGR